MTDLDVVAWLFLRSCLLFMVLHFAYKLVATIRFHSDLFNTLKENFPVADNNHWLLGHSKVTLANLHQIRHFNARQMKGQPAMIVDGPRFSGNTMLYIQDPELIKHILKDAFDKYTKFSPKVDYFWHKLSEWLGTGIFVSQHGPHAADGGKTWHLTRKVAAGIFTRSNFREWMFTTFYDKAKVLCDVVGETAEGECVDIQSKFFAFTMDSVMKLFYGRDTLTMKDKHDEYAAAYDDAHRNLLFFFMNTVAVGSLAQILPFPLGGLRLCEFGGVLVPLLSMWNPYGRKYREKVDYLNRETDKLVEEKRKDPNLADQKDLISLFLNSTDDNGVSMSDPKHSIELRDIVLNFIIAGRDTTACALTWALFILATNPEIQTKLQEELDSKLQGKDPNFDDLTPSNLPYLNGVIYETLRLYPPVPEDPKACSEDDVLPNGAKVKRGTTVVYNPFAMGRNPERYPNPLEVNPKRWIPFKPPNQYEFPVFQAGPRICLGMNMALLEARLVVVMLCSRFWFTMKEGEAEKIAPALMLTMSATNTPGASPDQGTHHVWMHVTPRNKS